MKGIVCEEPGRLRVTDIDPPKAKPGEALVRMRRIGICGSDLSAYKGTQPIVTYPRVLGHELAGEIAGLEDAGSDLRTGDRVAVLPYLECGRCFACRNGKTNCCTDLKVYGVHVHGGMQEYMAVPTDHLIKSETLGFDELAMVECMAIGAHAVRRSGVKPGEYALVIGAGPIGMGVIQFARAAGAKVIAVDRVEDRLKFCRDHFGLEYAVRAEGPWGDEVKTIAKGEYPSAVFDASGNLSSMEQAFNLVCAGGVVVMVGLVKEKISFFDPDFHRRELTVMSSRNATRGDLEYVMRSLVEGKAKVLPLITHRTTLDDLIARFPSWLKPESGVVKAVIEF
jgi:2-desacetyl-2-hydroxyethyl bacteriochlorophyllide A dehydrogenase